MKVLITGKGGQLAQIFENILKNDPNLEAHFYSEEDLDITHQEKVSSVFAKNKYDYCINCAAYTAVDRAEEYGDVAFRVNVIGAENLAKACATHSATLIHISTDFVFDGTKKEPYVEDDPAIPISVYGSTKLKGEQVIQSLLEEHFIIRTSWLYSEFGNNFVKTMVRLGKEKDGLKVVNDQIGSPTYALDLAKLIVHIIEGEIHDYGIYHYSNEGEISWFDFAKKIFEMTNLKVNLEPIPTKEYPTPAKRPAYSVMDKRKVKNVFGVQIPLWESSLKTCLENMNYA